MTASSNWNERAGRKERGSQRRAMRQRLSTADLKEYNLSNFRVTVLNQDAGVVTYFVDARASIHGEDLNEKRHDLRWG
jgi:hypothetical protein